MPFPLRDVHAWLDEAYSDGVPGEDAATLIALLRHRIGAEATLDLVLRLASSGRLDTSAAGEALDPDHLDQAALRRVSARLAAGGWPLAGPSGATGGDPADDEAPPDPQSTLGRIVYWLREGYPGGVPDHDYIPLLALLERRLTRSEVKKVAKALRRDHVSPASPGDIAAAITDLTNVEPSDEDLARVRDRLAKKGWPLDFPDPL